MNNPDYYRMILVFDQTICYNPKLASERTKDHIYKVYIDSTIPSYLVSKPSRKKRIADWQTITREFWIDNRFEFVLSDLVLTEIAIGDRSQSAARLQLVDGLAILDVLDLERMFAQQLVIEKAIPESALPDAIHVAVAAIHAIPYLATWNFAHLANRHTIPKIEKICQKAGYTSPRIASPQTRLEEVS